MGSEGATRTTTKRRVFAAGLVLLAAALTGCGDDDSGDGEPAAQADVGRYCKISKQLDRAGQKQFEELEQDPNATPKDFAAAERRLVEENEDLLAELQQVAPNEIREDVAVLIASLRARAGITEGPAPKKTAAAEKKITSFEKANCPSG
jgi:hypothetical protein